MVDPGLIRRRLLAQGLVTRPFESPAQAAGHLLASQGQDLPGVISSLALRLDRARDAGGAARAAQRVIDAFDDGSIVRGYPMRGTVFVTAAGDMRWLTELCAGGPLRTQTARRGNLGLDEEQVERARGILEETLAPQPRGIERSEVFAAWERAGLSPEGGRGYHLLSHFVARGIAVYGPWTGGENAVVLAESWLPAGSGLAERFDGDRTAAAAELLRRQLHSHGPATVRDVAWFSKLPLTLLRRALPLIADQLAEAGPDEAGEMRFEHPDLAGRLATTPAQQLDALHLLPGFDEMVLGYPDRSVLVPSAHLPALVPGSNGVFRRGVVRRGRMIGLWKRAGTAGSRRLEIEGFGQVPAIARREAERAFARFPFPAV